MSTGEISSSFGEPEFHTPQGILLTGEGLSLMTPERLQMLSEMTGGLGLTLAAVEHVSGTVAQSGHAAELDSKAADKMRTANEEIAQYPDLFDLFSDATSETNDQNSAVRWTEAARDVYRSVSKQSAEEGLPGEIGAAREDAIIGKFDALAYEAPDLALRLNETLAKSDLMQDRVLASVLIQDLAAQRPEQVLPILHSLLMDETPRVVNTAFESFQEANRIHDLYRYGQVEQMLDDYYEGRTVSIHGSG